MFEAAGLPYTKDIEKVPNTRKALRLGELARERGVFDALHGRLFDAYWAEGRDIGDDEVLMDLGRQAGLDVDEIREVLTTDRYGDIVQSETQIAMGAGASGVPAWVIDERLLVPGAQPHEVFEHVMARLGHDAEPRDDDDGAAGGAGAEAPDGGSGDRQ